MSRWNANSFLADGGAMGAMMRSFDWASTPVGPPSTWPVGLKTLVGVMLSAKQAMFIAWGPERTMLYNDGYARMCGLRHPAALGGSFRDLWFDIWDQVEPIITAASTGLPGRSGRWSRSGWTAP